MPLLRYLLAIAAAVLMAVVGWILRPLLGERPMMMLFMPAVVVSAWFGGMGPGLLATLVGAATIDFFWFRPNMGLVPGTRELVHISSFLFTGLLVSFLSE